MVIDNEWHITLSFVIADDVVSRKDDQEVFFGSGA